MPGNPVAPDREAANAASFPELPGIDAGEGLRRMMNKTHLYERVLQDFHQRFSGETEHIRKALADGDREAAQRRAHSTKGLAGSIGAARLQASALALEKAIASGTGEVDALLADYDAALRQVIDGILAYFGARSQV